MTKMPRKIRAIFLVTCLGIPAPSFASAFTISIPFSPPTGTTASPFEQEAIAAPLIAPLHSFTAHAAQIWKGLGSLLREMPAWQPDGAHQPMQMAMEETSASSLAPRHPKDPLAEEVSRQLFNRHDGIDFISPVAALARHGVFQLLRDRQSITSSELIRFLTVQGKSPNSGYWEIAMQVLAAQGWIVREGETAGAMTFRLTPLGYLATQKPYIDAYLTAERLIQTDFATVDQLDQFLVSASPRAPPIGALTFPEAVELSARQWNLPAETPENREIRQRILEHLDGLLVGVAGFTLVDRGVIWVNREGDKSEVQLAYHSLTLKDAVRQIGKGPVNQRYVQAALSLLVQQGWLQESSGGTYELTAKGALAARNVLASGVPISYLPMFARIDELLLGDPSLVFRRQGNQETHVARRINVIGSGAAHHTYFKQVVHLLDDIFNRPFDEQPQYIEDMGCGDGTYLKAMYEHILRHTRRGDLIRQDPQKYRLLMVGVDFNEAARQETGRNLSRARLTIQGKDYRIPHVMIFGDINNPDALVRKLKDLGLNPLRGVHTSTFLIHNRSFIDPKTWAEYSTDRGAYTSFDPRYKAQGYAIQARALDRNLVEFFRRWLPYITHFGLMTIELHSTRDDITAQNVGIFAGTSYISTHGFSGQYIITLPHFLELAGEAGLEVVEKVLKPRDLGNGHAPTSLLFLRAAA